MARTAQNDRETPAQKMARYQRIVEAFERAGLESSQTAIGKQMSPPITQGAVGAWQRGNPSIYYLCQICRLTGVSGHWLLLGEGPIYARHVPNSEAAIEAARQLLDKLSADSLESLLAEALKNRGHS